METNIGIRCQMSDVRDQTSERQKKFEPQRRKGRKGKNHKDISLCSAG